MPNQTNPDSQDAEPSILADQVKAVRDPTRGGKIPRRSPGRSALPAVEQDEHAPARQSSGDEGGGRLPLVHAGAMALHQG